MSRRCARQLALVPLGLILPIVLAVKLGLTAGIDRAGLLALSPPASFVPWIVAVTTLGDAGLRSGIAAVACVALLLTGHWRRAIVLAGTVAGGALLNILVKALVVRPRPAILPHLAAVTSWSFPSGHSANGAILYLSLALLAPVRWQPVAVGGAVLLVSAIGLSRVALAVHWPSDVAAGWLFGLGWVLLWRPLLVGRAVDRR